MSNTMATAFTSKSNTTDSDLLQESIDESILPGFSEDELLNLVQNGVVQSWDRVFYRLGLPVPQKGSGGSFNIITSLLSLWVERGGSSKIKLLDVLLQVKETYLFLLLGKEHVRLMFSMIGHHHSNVISRLHVEWKERCELAHAKFTDYLSHQRDVIQHSEEPLKTLAEYFFEGCLREIDFSHAAKQYILKKALIDFGFTEDTIDPKVIATWVIDKQQLLEIVEKLRMKRDIHDISRDYNYHYIEYFVHSVLLKHLSKEDHGLPLLMSSIIYCTSYSEYVALLQNAMIDTGISYSDDFHGKVTESDIKLFSQRFPKEKAENLSLALGVQMEEMESLQIILGMPTYMYPLYSTLSQWSKRTTFSRHKLFLAFCLSGYFDFATSQLYDMMPSDALVTKSFNQSGGEVYLEDHGIRLSVPMGALSGNQKITLTVLEEGPPIPSDDEVSICPGFRVSPSGLIFNLPIKVSLDHCVTVLQREQACKEGIVVYIRQEEGPKEQWKVMRYDLSTSSDCPVKVTLTHDKAEVYITHFTSFWIRVKSMFIGSKRIGCTPFLPKYMPSNRRPVLRLYVHNTSASTVKRIQEEEEKLVYCRATPPYDFTVIPNREQLTITCHDEGRSMHKTLSYEDLLTLRRRSKNRLDFDLDFTSLNHGEKNVKVDLFQGDVKRIRDLIIPTTIQESIVDHGAEDASGSEESSQSHGGVSETFEDIAAGFDDLSLESRESSASSRSEAAAASTCTGQLTNEQLMDIAIAIPGESFVRFFLSLGFPVDYPHKVLEKWGRSYRSASEQLICEWALKSGSKVDELRNALCSSELKFLAHQYLPSLIQE